MRAPHGEAAKACCARRRDARLGVLERDDVTRGKPDPEGYVRALAALGDGLAPPDVVAFEDTEAGVASARAAGLRCLAVRGTHPDERLAAADGIVDAIDVDLVRSLVG